MNAGTVVTIYALDAHGVFLGGLIVPGPRLMLHRSVGSITGIERIREMVEAAAERSGRRLMPARSPRKFVRH